MLDDVASVAGLRSVVVRHDRDSCTATVARSDVRSSSCGRGASNTDADSLEVAASAGRVTVRGK
jgi:hypothetical protein